MAHPTETRIFGAVLLEQRKVMEEIAGKDVVLRALSKLPEEARHEYERLSMLSWCRHTTATAVTTAVGQEIGRLPEDFQAEVVRTGIERTLRGLWRVLLRFSSDEALIKRSALIYSKTCDRGRLVAEPKGEGYVELTLSEWPDIPDLDVIALATGVETVLRVVGRRAKITWRRDGDVVRFVVRSLPGFSSRPPGATS